MGARRFANDRHSREKRESIFSNANRGVRAHAGNSERFRQDRHRRVCGRSSQAGYEIVSTGGTQAAIEAAGIPVTGISDVTGFPEILDGRVKTLHPAVHAGILARRDVPEHVQTLRDHAIVPVDVVASNLYPFVETLQSGADHEEIVENIDIGGPTLIRAAAKNADSVLVVVDPNDYAPVLAALEAGQADTTLRTRLAAKAFQHTASYDTHIARYFKEIT